MGEWESNPFGVMKIKLEWVIALVFLLIMGLGCMQLSNSFYMIHDNLDSEVIFKTQPAKEGLFFQLSNQSVVSGYMGDIPKNAYTNSPFNLISWLFFLLPASWAMFILVIGIRVVAFTGMMLLLKTLSAQENTMMRKLSIGFLSIGFAMLPFYAIHGFAIPGLPLALLALLRIQKNEKIYLNLGLLLLYGFASSFILGGFAFLALLGGYILWMIVRKKEGKWRMLLAMVVLTLSLALSDIGLFIQFFTDSQFVSHRTEWVLSGFAFKPMLHAAFDLFMNGQYHAPSEHLPLLLFIPIFVIINWKNGVHDRKFWLLLVGIIGVAFFAAWYKSIYALNVRSAIPFLKAFQLDRFYFLYAVAWILCYFYASRSDRPWKQYLALCGAFGFCIFALAKNEEWLSNVTGKKHSEHVENWDTYYGVNKCNELYVLAEPQQTKRVLHYGIDPAVGAFLGYATLDGYHTNYPVILKHDFMELIGPALEFNESYAENIQSWGSKLVLPINAKHEILLNWEKAKIMQLSYIFSAFELENHKHLHLKGKIPNFNSFGDLYVYELN